LIGQVNQIGRLFQGTASPASMIMIVFAVPSGKSSESFRATYVYS